MMKQPPKRRRTKVFFGLILAAWLLTSLYFSGLFPGLSPKKRSEELADYVPEPPTVAKPMRVPRKISVPRDPIDFPEDAPPLVPDNPPSPLKSAPCLHTVDRDYQSDPIQFLHLSKERECDVRCVPGTADISRSEGDCGHTKSYEFTMENTGRSHGDDRIICGNTLLSSDVVMQYFSWEEYDFMSPPRPKVAASMMVAMISNCGPQERLTYLQALMDSGITVDSFGRCLNNKPMPTKIEDLGESAFQNQKFAFKERLVADYKFVFSFENSVGEDYVSEKLWGMLVSGAIPVYHGGKNVRKMVPSNRSVIFADDFQNPQHLAEFLKKVAADEKLYNSYLQWKYDGPSKDFVALVDLSLVHSECRFCIRAADLDRKNIGEVNTGPWKEENEREMKDAPAGSTMLKVRERGKFYLRRVHLTQSTISEMRKKVLQKYSDKDVGDIYKMYRLWDRAKEAIVNDKDVGSLKNEEEIEIIFENPNIDRFGYSHWLKKGRANSTSKH